MGDLAPAGEGGPLAVDELHFSAVLPRFSGVVSVV